MYFPQITTLLALVAVAQAVPVPQLDGIIDGLSVTSNGITQGLGLGNLDFPGGLR
jgi:hypothetical protein